MHFNDLSIVSKYRNFEKRSTSGWNGPEDYFILTHSFQLIRLQWRRSLQKRPLKTGPGLHAKFWDSKNLGSLLNHQGFKKSWNTPTLNDYNFFQGWTHDLGPTRQEIWIYLLLIFGEPNIDKKNTLLCDG